MHVEVSVALNFVISYLYTKLPRRRVDMFGEELERGIKKKFEGHWYADKPYKGSAFRCIRATTEKVEPVIEMAASLSGLDIDEIRGYLPKDLTIWIDPGDVSYRIGEKGAVKILYSTRRDDDSYQSFDREIAAASKGFNPDAQCFKPIDSLSSSLSNLSVSPGTTSPTPTACTNMTSSATSPWAVGSTSPNGGSFSSSSPSAGSGGSTAPMASFLNRNLQAQTMTTAMFAQTKFGSTKLKSQGKRPARLSPTELGAFIKQRATPAAMATAPVVNVAPVGLGPFGLQGHNRGVAPIRPRALSPCSTPHHTGASSAHVNLDQGAGRCGAFFLMQQQAIQGNPSLHCPLSSGLPSPLGIAMTDLYTQTSGHLRTPSFAATPPVSVGAFSDMFPASQGACPTNGLPTDQNTPSPDGNFAHKSFMDGLNVNALPPYANLQHLLVAN